MDTAKLLGFEDERLKRLEEVLRRIYRVLVKEDTDIVGSLVITKDT